MSNTTELGNRKDEQQQQEQEAADGDVQQLQNRIEQLSVADSKPSEASTGLFYDERMLLHKEDSHPESPARYLPQYYERNIKIIY